MTKTTLLIATLLTLSMGIANAQSTTGTGPGTCSAMWKDHKASADYKDPGKGNRMAAWNEFRKAKCGKAAQAKTAA